MLSFNKYKEFPHNLHCKQKITLHFYFMSIQMQKLHSHKFIQLVFWCLLFPLQIKSRYFHKTCWLAEQGRQQQMDRTQRTKERPEKSQRKCLQGAPHCSRDITDLGSLESPIHSWRETIFKKCLPQVIREKERGDPEFLENHSSIPQDTGHVPFTWRACGGLVRSKKNQFFQPQPT